MSNIKIKKAAIKSQIFLECDYEITEMNVKKIRKEHSDAVIHGDLKNAMDRLVPHFALITEQVEKSAVEKIILGKAEMEASFISKYRVSGFSIGGSGESEGITISGRKVLENGKVVNFNTPFIKWENPAGEDYDFIQELSHEVNSIFEEVIEFMGGKYGIKEQTSMDFGDDFVDDDASDFNPIVSENIETAEVA